MPYLPQIITAPQSKDVTDTFYGYNHKLKIGPGEFYHTENLSTRDFPMLATRKRRGMVRKLDKPQGLLAKGGKLAWVDDGVLYYDGEATSINALTYGYKQLVNMGAYICVFPDKAYYNTKDTTDYGYMEAHLSLPSSGVTYQLCTLTGSVYDDVQTEKPDNPANGAYWYDKDNKSLKQYSAAQEDWVTIATVYTKISFTNYTGNLKDHLRDNDGVELNGMLYDVLNGTKILYAVEPKAIVVVGLIDTADAALDAPDKITIRRSVPKMDFVCECQNRLWGCYSGKDEQGKYLNEIYCCALGDPRNWRQYMGLSTDSWTASIGSDGPWTGAINFLGYPTFFKENTIHRVTVSATGAHSVYETPARGVQEGSGKSLAIINEELLYKSRADVCAYQGGFPAGISAALGDQRFKDAVAGSYGSYYCISMLDEDKHWNLFCYNMANNLWMREDDMHALDIVSASDSMYALDDHGVIWDLLGHDGELETELHWTAQTGILYYYTRGSRGAAVNTNRKYTSRYTIQLNASKDSTIAAFVQYDSDGVWRFQGKTTFNGLNSIVFPIRPRRCDHLEIRLEGTGDVKIYGITRILEEGSDV